MEPSPLKGSKTMLLGVAGSGKTHALRTLNEIKGLRKIVLFTENAADRISDLADFHWATCMPGAGSLEELYAVANMTHSMSFKALTELDHLFRERYNNFLDLIVTLNHFHDAKTGEDLGSADSWGPDTVLAIDGLTNICQMVVQHHVGAKPMMSPGQYMICQGTLMSFLRQLTTNVKCHLVLICHLSKILDETTSLYVNQVDSIGKAIAGDIPKLFSDVILARRVGDGTQFDWSNADTSAATKPGLLPPTLTMPPTFVPLFEAWQAKGGLFSPTYKEAADTQAK